MCVTWLIHMCDMTQSYVWHDSFMCHSYVYHEDTHMTESCQTNAWVTLHIWRSHVTHIYMGSNAWNNPDMAQIQRGNTSPWVMSHMRMSHVTYMNVSCRTHPHPHQKTTNLLACNAGEDLPHNSWPTWHWVQTHVWTSHVAHIHIRKPRTCSHARREKRCLMSHVTRDTESTHMYEWVMSHTSTLENHELARTQSGRPKCQMRGVTSHTTMGHVTHKWVMSHLTSHVAHIHIRKPRTCSHAKRETQVPNERSYITHDNGSCHTYRRVMSHLTSHVTHMNASCRTYERVMSHISTLENHELACTQQDGSPHAKCEELYHTRQWVTSHI